MFRQINKKITVNKELVDASKGLLTLGVIISKVKVEKINQELWGLLQTSGESQKRYDSNKINEIEQIKALRDTYKNLGLKLSEYKGSNEALLKRVLTNKGLYQINTVVDVNNYISINSLRSVGSYDLSNVIGDIEFRRGKVEEKYTGTTKRPLKLNNLPVLCDENGPFGSPTSDSDRALIKDSTTSLMTVIFSFDGTENLEEQVSQMATLLQKYANASDVNTYLVKDEVAEFTCEIEVE
jgi:DNA/RNA-binding domain of Phe-tRNA-synthetase-like protein